MGETLTLHGLLCETRDGDGYGILAIARIDNGEVEIVARWADYTVAGRRISLRYWIADVPVTEQVKIEALREVMGTADADYGHRYSEVTGYLWTDEKFNVGGHDMIAELSSHVGKFLLLEVEFNPAREV